MRGPGEDRPRRRSWPWSCCWPPGRCLWSSPREDPIASWQAGLYWRSKAASSSAATSSSPTARSASCTSPVLYGEGLFLVAFAFTTAVRFALDVALHVDRAASSAPPLGARHLLRRPRRRPSQLGARSWSSSSGVRRARTASRRHSAFRCSSSAVASWPLSSCSANSTTGSRSSPSASSLSPPARRRRRNLATFLGVFGGLTGRPLAGRRPELANLPAMSPIGMQIVAGYSRAMGIDVDSPRPTRYALALAAVAQSCLRSSALVTRGETKRARIASLAAPRLLRLRLLQAGLHPTWDRRARRLRADDGRGRARDRGPVRPERAAPLARGARDGVGRALGAAALLAPVIALVVWANPATTFTDGAGTRRIHLTIRARRPRKASDSRPCARTTALRRAAKRCSRATPSPQPMLRRIGERTVAIEPVGNRGRLGLWPELEAAAGDPGLRRLHAAARSPQRRGTARRRPADDPSAQLRGDEAAACSETSIIATPPGTGRRRSWRLLCNYGEVLKREANGSCSRRARGPMRPAESATAIQAQTGAAISRARPAPPRSAEIVFARVRRAADRI